MQILKVTDHDEAQEQRFELYYLLSLTILQCFPLMLDKSNVINLMLLRHGL
jgi:hypothetical protein